MLHSLRQPILALVLAGLTYGEAACAAPSRSLKSNISGTKAITTDLSVTVAPYDVVLYKIAASGGGFAPTP